MKVKHFLTGLMTAVFILSISISVSASSISLSKSSITLLEGQSKTITATVTGSSRTVKWSSSDTKVAIVNSGTISARGAGTCYIRATANGKTKSCKIIVKPGKWRAAYANFLKKNKTTNTSDNRFLLAYIDNNEVPELVLIRGYYHYVSPEVYTCVNGVVRKIGGFGSAAVMSYAPRTGRIWGNYMGMGGILDTFYTIKDKKKSLVVEFERYDEYWGDTIISSTFKKNKRSIDAATYNRQLTSSKKAFKYRLVGYDNGFVINDANIQKVLKNPASVVK